jgi:ATP-dependent Lon protease
MRVLQDEISDGGSDRELEDMRAEAPLRGWKPDILTHFLKELDKTERSNPASPDYSIGLSYLELFFSLPWGKFSKDNLDIKNAEKILEKEHHGLAKVKKRILEYLAVMKLTDGLRGPILCLYGPPGVGKTSLGKSVAKALGRKYVRMSLGGLHDEAEIRGHRKTYIGAMPGRIIQNLKKAGTDNPVFVLDEIDKVGSDFRGDPASALLEVLDPEQNTTFQDNYLEVEYDLSKVLFIATANSLDSIHPALRDRMEIIELNGYAPDDKIEIAKKHILPKQRKEHGLKAADLSLDAAGIRAIIEGYTFESGVRNLEQKIAAVCRFVAKSVATGESYPKKVKEEHLADILGKPIFDRENYADNNIAGVVTGLAWTAGGGDILSIETNLTKGSGKLTLSGQLGDVMKESAVAALTFLKSRAEKLLIDHKIFDKYDLHIHIPAGAVPKDGPSAGITLFTALASLYTQRKVLSKLAMTGEITIKGRVLPVGGIKEKVLAAKRAGIEEIILCKRNQRDIEEIEKHYIEGMKFHYVEFADDVLAKALTDEKVPEPLIFPNEEK